MVEALQLRKMTLWAIFSNSAFTPPNRPVSSGKSMDAIEAELESELAAIGNVVAHYDASLAEAESIRLTTRRHLMPM